MSTRRLRDHRTSWRRWRRGRRWRRWALRRRRRRVVRRGWWWSARRLSRHRREMLRLSGLLRKTFSEPVDDLLERGARGEDLRHPSFLERRDVVVGDDSATEDDDVGRIP